MNFVRPISVKCGYPPTIGFGKMGANILYQIHKKRIEIVSPGSSVLELLIETLHGASKVRPKSIFYTMWESSVLPKKAVPYLNKSKMVIVPSTYNKEVFINNGVKKLIAIVPLGVDTNIYHKIETEKQDTCVFGIAGTYYPRKNIPFVLNAFKKAFDGKNAILKVKTSARPKIPPELISHPQIQYSFGDYKESLLCEWYNSLDAFVSCSHGEGWGLHQLEAMSCGVPLISPRFGGIAEYFDEQVGYCVDYNMSIPLNNNDSFYEGEWCDAKEDSLIEAMFSVYNDREEATKRGNQARERACIFTWGDCVDKLVKEINSYVMVTKLG
jgi:glycosyltransferase involved in cell wall biosynthesis